MKPKNYKTRSKRAYKMAGFAFAEELDGIRILTSSEIYFLERVQKPLQQALNFVQGDPSNMLIDAYKEF